MQAIEFASFTGGLGKEATIFYSRLADLLFFKYYSDFGCMLSLMRWILSFSLLCSAILAIRGSQAIKFAEHPSISNELCLVESRIDFSV